MRRGARLRRPCLADRSGATAVEFALVLPPFLMLVIGGFYVAGLGYSQASLQFAVEAAARCASVKTTVCTGNSTITSYAASQYFASGFGAPTFTYAAATCGQQVNGSLTFAFNYGLSSVNVPLTATACFP